jgi:hypothetical protein
MQRSKNSRPEPFYSSYPIKTTEKVEDKFYFENFSPASAVNHGKLQALRRNTLLQFFSVETNMYLVELWVKQITYG